MAQRLTEEIVRAKLYLLNQNSKKKYEIRDMMGWWTLYCKNDGGLVAEGNRGTLRELFDIINGIRSYLLYERLDNDNREIVQG